MRPSKYRMFQTLIMILSGPVGGAVFLLVGAHKWPWYYIGIALALYFFVFLWIPIWVLDAIDRFLDRRRDARRLKADSKKVQDAYNQVWNAQDPMLPYDARQALTTTILERNRRNEKVQQILEMRANAKQQVAMHKTTISICDEQLKLLGHGEPKLSSQPTKENRDGQE